MDIQYSKSSITFSIFVVAFLLFLTTIPSPADVLPEAHAYYLDKPQLVNQESFDPNTVEISTSHIGDMNANVVSVGQQYGIPGLFQYPQDQSSSAFTRGSSYDSSSAVNHPIDYLEDLNQEQLTPTTGRN